MDIPPKVVHRRGSGLPTQVAAPSHVGPAPSEGKIQPRQAGAVSTQLPPSDAALPVLGALEQFIHKERKRNRKAMLTLMVISLIMMASFVGAGLLLGKAFVGRLNALKANVAADNENVHDRMTSINSQIALVHGTLSNETYQLHSRIADRNATIDASTERIDRTRSAVRIIGKHLTNSDAHIAALQAAIAEMEIENAMSLNAFQSQLSTATSRIETLTWRNAELRNDLLTRQPTTETLAPSPDGKPITNSIPLSIQPSSAPNWIHWRLPLSTAESSGTNQTQ